MAQAHLEGALQIVTDTLQRQASGGHGSSGRVRVGTGGWQEGSAVGQLLRNCVAEEKVRRLLRGDVWVWKEYRGGRQGFLNVRPRKLQLCPEGGGEAVPSAATGRW